MAISFAKLHELLKERGLNKNYLRKNGINPNMLDQILETGNTGTKTIDKICKILDCQPGDIMEYIKSNEGE